MHRKTFIGAAVALVSTVVLTGTAWADRLDDIKKAGVLRVAAFDGNPPFGYIDATQDEAAFDFIANTLGTRQMPVGVARDEDGNVLDWWTGFNPDKLDEWVGKAGLLGEKAAVAA